MLPLHALRLINSLYGPVNRFHSSVCSSAFSTNLNALERKKRPDYPLHIKITENGRETEASRINTYGLITSEKSLGSGFMIINMAT